MRGLKYDKVRVRAVPVAAVSHPTRVRGLKAEETVSEIIGSPDNADSCFSVMEGVFMQIYRRSLRLFFIHICVELTPEERKIDFYV